MSLPEIAQALTLLGIAGLAGLILRSERRLTRIETVVTGADGSNGINGTVKQLRREHDALRGEVEAQAIDIARIQERIA